MKKKTSNYFVSSLKIRKFVCKMLGGGLKQYNCQGKKYLTILLTNNKTIMKKRLLSLAAVALTTLSGFAFEAGEIVYTPQGKFQITSSDNICTNGLFAEGTDGWNSLEGEGTPISSFLAINPSGDNGLDVNSLQSTDATAAHGAYYTWTPADPSGCYIVSFKIKAATSAVPAVTTQTWHSVADGVVTHDHLVAGKGAYVNLFGNTGSAITSGADFVSSGSSLMLSSEWQTVSFAVVGDGTERTWYLLFKGMTVGNEIADVQIQEAVKGYDDRKAAKILGLAKAVRDIYDWQAHFSEKAGLKDDYQGLVENIIAVEGLTFEDGVDGDAALLDLEDVFNSFLTTYFEDYFASCKADTYWPTSKTSVRGVGTFGDWVATSNPGRGIGHYWNKREEQMPSLIFGNYGFGQPLGTQTMTMTKTLKPGIYVWALDGMRYTQYTSYSNNQGLKIGQMQLFIGSDTTDVVALNTNNYDGGTYIVMNITEEKEVGIGAVLSNISSDYDSQTLGGSFEVANPVLRFMLSGEFNGDQLLYWSKVKEQITTAVNAVKKANDYIANTDYVWGKDSLQMCLDTIASRAAHYAALDSSTVIRETYQVGWTASTSAATSLMIYEVYTNAVKDILAANRKFEAVNKNISNLEDAIANAEDLSKQRMFDAATGKEVFAQAIADAKGVLATMKASQYSEANVATINEEIQKLADASDAFRASVPASAKDVIADIDFSGSVVENTETGGATVAGTVNSIELPSYSEFSGDVCTFENGYGAAEPKDSLGILRVGNGSATVNIDAEKQVSGTNILHATLDFYFGRLMGGKNDPAGVYAGFDFLDENDERVAGFSYNGYWTKAEYDDFGIDFGLIPAVGRSGQENAMIAAASNKTHFDISIDYGKGTMFCTITSAKGTKTTTEIAIPNTNPIAKFVVKSTHNNTGRRCWFDNLFIEKVEAGDPTAVSEVKAADAQAKAAAKKVVNGQLVIETAKGTFNAAGAQVK